jgi:hypothetical protein
LRSARQTVSPVGTIAGLFQFLSIANKLQIINVTAGKRNRTVEAFGVNDDARGGFQRCSSVGFYVNRRLRAGHGGSASAGRWVSAGGWYICQIALQSWIFYCLRRLLLT